MTKRMSVNVRKMFDELPTNPHIIDLARRVHPTWVAANGHMNDLGIEHLTHEIAQCIAAIEHGREQGEDMRLRYVIGHGIVVTGSGMTEENYRVAVVAGEAFRLRMELEVK